MAFFCEVGGGISTDSEIKKVKGQTHKRINIGVYPISNIEGDVDYHSGNIDFNGDVVIGGSVQSQFSVKATGTVTIAGYVEAGAFVTAGNDLLVQRGVVGASTELVAGGDVMAKFIQEATVRAGGDIKVGSYIFNASVRAAGQIMVPGMGEGKSRALVGGLIWGAKGISALSIGSPYNTSTRLVVGVDPDQVNRADQIRANMHACQQKLLEKIGVDSVDLTHHQAEARALHFAQAEAGHAHGRQAHRQGRRARTESGGGARGDRREPAPAGAPHVHQCPQ